MTIKAWPYGGKPGVAVAKETKSRLLTVWPLKLWGAVTPVAQRKKKIKAKHRERNNQWRSCFVLCEIFTLSNLWIGAWWLFSGGRDNLVDLHRQWLRLCSNTPAVHRQLRKRFYQSFVLAMKPWIFNSTLNQLAMNTTLLWSILYLSQLPEPNPLETVTVRHITSPLLGDN